MIASDTLSQGHTWGSDVLLLLAMILFLASALMSVPMRVAADQRVPWWKVWVWVPAFGGLAALALAWLIL